MTQLVQPNQNAVGRIGWCLEYAARVWGTTHTEPYAWTAWLNTQFKHTDPIPTDVAVPCWFSYTLGGLNEGHIVASIPGVGFLSSPWQPGTTHAVLPSIAEVERIYGCKYVGWSEDILNLKLIGEDSLNQDQIDSMAHAYLNDSIANNPGLAEYIGRPVGEVIAAFNGAPERAAYLKSIEDKDKIIATYQLAQGNVEATAIGTALIKLFQTFGYKKG